MAIKNEGLLRDETKTNYKSIILSGLPCSGKTTLAHRLCEIYGWPIYSLGQIWKDEHARLHPGTDISFEDFWRDTSPISGLLLNVVAKGIFEQGNCIGETRYAPYLNNQDHLFVFVTADIQTRARRAAGREDYKAKTFDEMTRILLKRESDEASMGKKLFGNDYDYRDHCLYRLVIDSGNLSLEQEVCLVREVMDKKVVRNLSTSKNR